MMRGRFLFVLWSTNILALALSITGNSCVSDYIRSITCAWNITGPMDRSNNSFLRFNESDDRSKKHVSCPVVVTDQGYFCNCKVSDSTFASFSKFDIEHCIESTCQALQNDFRPYANIKMTPPPEVEPQQSTDSIRITCKSEKYENSLIRDLLEYEILLQDSHSRWNRTFYTKSPQNVETIDRKILPQQNTEYCVKARFKVQNRGYISTWSEWSEPVCWSNKQKKEQEDIVPLLLKSLGPVCIAVGILLFVFYNPATRMKIKTLAHTPTPAPFFKPLFQQHEGNLQEWLSPYSKDVLTYKTEEDLIADVVTVVPKSSPKDLEESQIFLTIPATQLVFPLSHTSYVGLPGMDKASPPIPVVYPGDTPYTQLPCSVWGPGVQEVEVVCSDPKDFLELSHSDSGCSCENLTQSLECSLPCSPVDEIPSPSHCNDYCILNKTAQGMVPVLLSKERAGDVPSDSLKSEG